MPRLLTLGIMQVAFGTNMCGIVLPSLTGSYSAALPMTLRGAQSGASMNAYCTYIPSLDPDHAYSVQFTFRMVGKNVATSTMRQVRASDAIILHQ